MPHRTVRAVLVCAALAACAQRASVISGSPQAADGFSDTSPAGAQADVRLVLVATPAAGEPRTFRFVGEITGGADNNPDLVLPGNHVGLRGRPRLDHDPKLHAVVG